MMYTPDLFLLYSILTLFFPFVLYISPIQNSVRISPTPVYVVKMDMNQASMIQSRIRSLGKY